MSDEQNRADNLKYYMVYSCASHVSDPRKSEIGIFAAEDEDQAVMVMLFDAGDDPEDDDPSIKLGAYEVSADRVDEGEKAALRELWLKW